jgi:hypothetical protein
MNAMIILLFLANLLFYALIYLYYFKKYKAQKQIGSLVKYVNTNPNKIIIILLHLFLLIYFIFFIFILGTTADTLIKLIVSFGILFIVLIKFFNMYNLSKKQETIYGIILLLVPLIKILIYK